MREVTRHTAGATPAAQQPLAVTAYGVLMAIEAAVRHYYQRPDLAGLRFAVQGLGNVGYPLCEHLSARGARLVVSDVDPARTARAAQELRAEVVGPEAIYEEPADVLAPCALGAVLNDRTIPRLRVRLVCGGANNQLAEPRHDAVLAARGIAYVPDYLANAGGVIDFYQESVDDRPEAVLASVERIRDITAAVLARAAAGGETPLQVADRIVRDRIRGAA
jgi:leucine dehydrogenase